MSSTSRASILDAVYLQQNSFDPVDAAVSPERQKSVFALVIRVLGSSFDFKDKDEARDWFYKLRQSFLDMNGIGMEERSVRGGRRRACTPLIDERKTGLDAKAARILESLEN